MQTLTKLLLVLSLVVGRVSAATYYLDVDATGSANGTSWTDAWTSFGQVAITGGDTLEIAEGTYNLTATFFPPSGTSGATPTHIRVAQDGTHSGPVIIDGGDTVHPLFRFSNDRWITIDGEYAGATNFTFQNWGGAGTNTDSFALSGGGGSYCHTNVLRYVKVINDQYMQSDDLRIPVYMSYAKGCLISHCWVEGGMRASINITAYGDPDAWDWNVVEYTTIKGYMDSDGRGGPDGVKGTATVRYCYIYHVPVAGAHVNPSHTAEDAIQWLSSWNAAYGNVIWNYSQSHIRTDVNTMMSNVWVFNNLMYSSHVNDGAIQRGVEFDGDNYINCLIANNTIADLYAGIRVIKGSATQCDVRVLNNIMINCTIGMSETGGDHDDFVADYNLLLNADYSQNTSGFAGAIASYAQTHPTFDAGKSFAFTSYISRGTNQDFSIGSVDYMGVDTAYDLESELVVQGFPATDIIEATRPSGAWDVGAYELDGGADPGFSGTAVYVSATGSDTNVGTISHPVLTYTNAVVIAAAEGVTNIIFRNGSYPSMLVQTTGIRLAAENSRQAIVTNSAGYGLQTWACSGVTVDGLTIQDSYNSGIKFSTPGNWATNCWLLRNGNTLDTSGIECNAAASTNTLVENCLIELNGDFTPVASPQGHGIYASGTGQIIRGNTIRSNAGFGIQYYSGGSVLQHGALIYNNLVYGHTGAYGATIYGATESDTGAGTNYVFNNTILDGLDVEHGWVMVTNNIIWPNSRLNTTTPIVHFRSGSVPVISSDYNLTPYALTNGTHNIVTNDAHLAADYRLTEDSPAVDAGTDLSAYFTTDLAGDPRGTWDIGAFSFTASGGGEPVQRGRVGGGRIRTGRWR